MRLTPAKFIVAFAALGYVVVGAMFFAPPSFHPSAAIVFGLCPACILTFLNDPHWPTVFAILGPVNALAYAIYGSVLLAFGVVIGGAWNSIRNRFL